MKTIRTSILAFTLTAALVGLIAPAVASAQATKSTDFVTKDVKDRTVSSKTYRGKVLLVFINSHETGDAMRPVTEKMILKYGHNPKVAQVSIADLTELDFYKKPFAKDHISGAHDRTVKRIKALLKKNGKPPIPGLSRNLHIIMDMDGELVKRFQHFDPLKVVTVVVLNKEGDAIGSWKGSQLDKVFEAVDAALAE